MSRRYNARTLRKMIGHTVNRGRPTTTVQHKDHAPFPGGLQSERKIGKKIDYGRLSMDVHHITPFFSSVRSPCRFRGIGPWRGL
jgi:hypothetical protein